MRKVEEEAGYGKGRNESQCERGYRGEDDVCSGNFYQRDAMLARVIAIATCLSVRLFFRLSVTRRHCVKTKKASGMISSSSGSPKALVF